MKTKQNILIISFLLTFSSLQAQMAPLNDITRNLVLVEITTGTWCAYCAGSAMGADDLIENGHSVAIVENHGYDDFDNIYSTSRNNYYNVTGYPTAFFDGILSYVGGHSSNSMYGVYLPFINQRMAVLTPFDIDFTFIDNGNNSYTLSADVSKVGDYSEDVVLHVFITESNIQENWQGQDHLNFVNRLMVPGVDGTSLDFSNSNNITEELTFSVDPIWNVDDCEIVVAIQDMATKEVFNAAKANLNQPYDPEAIVSINPTTQTVNTNETFTTNIEIADVTNLGSFELELNFDPNYLQANSVTLGDFLGITGRQIFPLVNSIDNTNGLIEYAVTTMGATPPGPDGDGVLLSIEWTSAATVANEVTTDLILQSLQLTEPNGTVLTASTQNGSVIISPCYVHDFDCDCDVDIVDVTMAAYRYGTETGDANYDPAFDLDSDGDIDIVDITMVTYDYGWTCSKSSSKTIKFDNVNNEDVILGLSSINDNYDGSYNIDLYVEYIKQLGGYELEFGFDPNVLEVLDIEQGSLIGSTERITQPLKSIIDNKTGRIYYSIVTLGSQTDGASGNGMLLKIRCKSLNSSVETLDLISAQLVRIDAQVIDYTFKSNTIDINGETYIISTYPSPFKNNMSIQYNVGQEGKIAFQFYNVYGGLVKSTEGFDMEAGSYTIAFDGLSLSAGVYIISLAQDGVIVDTRRIIVK